MTKIRNEKRTSREYAPRLAPEDRRDQLLDAALAIGVDHGFDGITMAAVAEACGITRPVVYSQFANGDDLLAALFDREVSGALADLAAAIPEEAPPADPRQSYLAAVTRFIGAVRTHQHRWKFILVPPHGVPAAVRDEVAGHRQRIEREMERVTAWHIGPDAADHSLVSLAVIGVLEKLATVLVTNPTRFTDDEILDFAALLFDALSGWMLPAST